VKKEGGNVRGEGGRGAGQVMEDVEKGVVNWVGEGEGRRRRVGLGWPTRGQFEREGRGEQLRGEGGVEVGVGGGGGGGGGFGPVAGGVQEGVLRVVFSGCLFFRERGRSLL